MTPAERALLLAVAKTLRRCLVPEHAAALYPHILAVEAEAAFAAEDDAELAEVAAKARACEAEVCPTCNGMGFGLPSEPKQDTTCPTCEGTGKKEKTDDHT